MSRKPIANAAPEELDDAALDVAGGSGRRVELDHMGAYNFTVEIEGVSAGKTIIGGFKSMSGMDSETEVIE